MTNVDLAAEIEVLKADKKHLEGEVVKLNDTIAKSAERLKSAKHGLHNLLIDYNIKDMSKVSTLVDDFVNKDYDMTNPSKAWTDAYNAFKKQLADLIVANFISLPGSVSVDTALAKSKLDSLSLYSDPTKTTQVPTTKPAFTDNNAVTKVEVKDTRIVSLHGRQFTLVVNGKEMNISTGVNIAGFKDHLKTMAGAIANAVWTEGLEHGFGLGYEQGFDKGYDQGYDKGYDDGYRDGYDDGFRDGVKSVSK